MKMNLIAQFLQPLPPHRALECAVDAAGGLRVARPPHDHLAVLDAVDEPVGLFGDAESGAVSPRVDRAPMPTIPAVRVVVDHGRPDGVHEAGQQGMPIVHECPRMMRRALDDDRARTEFSLAVRDLVRHHVERLVPGDALVPWVPGISTGLRLAPELLVALPLRVEADALQRVEQPLVGVDVRLGSGRDGRHGRLARRRERPPMRLDLV